MFNDKKYESIAEELQLALNKCAESHLSSEDLLHSLTSNLIERCFKALIVTRVEVCDTEQFANSNFVTIKFYSTILRRERLIFSWRSEEQLLMRCELFEEISSKVVGKCFEEISLELRSIIGDTIEKIKREAPLSHDPNAQNSQSDKSG
ncbi:MAG: hypothetical protein MHMPM18_002401, partial [Marteilia pararefringens]